MNVRLLVTISLMTACSAVGEAGAGDETATDEESAEAGTNGHAAASCVHQLAPRNDSEIMLCNDLGEPIISSIAMPDGDPPPGGWPGVVMLHGSGGSFLSGKEEEDPCLEALDYEFSDWAERLNERGYAVLTPASYYSRGFCEWNDDTRPDNLNKHEMLILRVFDAIAAANYLCDDPQVDCSRLAMLGFSAGATVALLLMHEDLSDTYDSRLHHLDDVPAFVGAVAYYPGCGLEGELVNEIDESAIERYYYPMAPVFVPHGEKDHLVDDCEEIRDPQVDAVAEQKGVDEDMFELKIYDNAKHSFDGTPSDGRPADFAASNDARDRTLKKFEKWF
jgi:dienelactone hydrolase